MVTKVVRSICYFAKNPDPDTLKSLDGLADSSSNKGYEIQTKRLCSPAIDKIRELDREYAKNGYIFGVGSLTKAKLIGQLDDLLSCLETHLNLDLTCEQIDLTDAQILFEIIKNNSSKTFNFAYIFNNPPSSPFFPSANYQQDGFSIGLQPTDLSLDCSSPEEWFRKMEKTWVEIYNLFKTNVQFLGIDSSIAPLVSEQGSFIGFIKRLKLDFSRTVTTDFYLRISQFIKEKNPKPVGLCGLMFPCLEDAELAKEYEQGNFSIERNTYLSLHCGLGIDTYPIGVDEKPERVSEILKLLQGLSNKYKKPLSCRFVSDGKAKIGEKTNFQNQYLQDVIVRAL